MKDQRGDSILRFMKNYSLAVTGDVIIIIGNFFDFKLLEQQDFFHFTFTIFRYLTIFAQSQNVPKRSPLHPFYVRKF